MRGRVLRLGGPVVLVLVVLVAVGIGPSLRRANQARDDVAVAERNIDTMAARLAVLRPLATESDALEGLSDELSALVPTAIDIPGVIVDLDAVALRAGVELRDVVPTPAVDGETSAATPPGWTSVRLGVRVLGGYADIARFVDELSSTSRLVVVDRVGLVADDSGVLVGDLDLRVFASAHEPPSLDAEAVLEGVRT